MSTTDRRTMLDRGDPSLSMRSQCAMLGLSRSGVYRQRAANDADAADRRIVPAASVPRLASDRCVAVERGGAGKPQAGSAADAADGDRGNRAEDEHVEFLVAMTMPALEGALALEAQALQRGG